MLNAAAGKLTRTPYLGSCSQLVRDLATLRPGESPTSRKRNPKVGVLILSRNVTALLDSSAIRFDPRRFLDRVPDPSSCHQPTDSVADCCPQRRQQKTKNSWWGRSDLVERTRDRVCFCSK